MSNKQRGKADVDTQSEQVGGDDAVEESSEDSPEADKTLDAEAAADDTETPDAADHASADAAIVDAPVKKKKAKRTGQRRSKRSSSSSRAELSEEQIDSPSKQTLGMLSVVAAATLVMWGVGRAKCNYREVGEGMKPRDVTLEERTRTPKDVAFAFQHAVSSKDFAVASKLATGPAKAFVEKQQAACKGESCKKQHEELSGQVKSAAELLKRTTSKALARVWSQGPDPAADKHVVVLARDGRDWKVESYGKDQGKEIELPGEASNAPTGARAPSPPGSARQPSTGTVGKPPKVTAPPAQRQKPVPPAKHPVPERAPIAPPAGSR